MLPPPLPADVFEALPLAVQLYIHQLEQSFQQLTKRVSELETRLNQNSSNSSKPPSSDGPQVKPASPKKSSGKKRGGQPGHPKQERTILSPDEIIDHKPSRCRGCRATLVGDDPEPIIEQIIDLPAKLRHVIHHRRHRLCCPACHAITIADSVPEAMSGFGPKLTAVTAYLSGVGRLSKRTIRTLFGDLCDIPMSLGSVCKLEAKVSAALKKPCDEALEFTQGQDANIDETGWKQGPKKAWLWVAVTSMVTVFLIRLHRNHASFQDLTGPVPGILTTDRYSVYTHLDPDQRQVCWAHLRRDFQAMIDRKNAGTEIGESLLWNAEIMFEHWQKVRDGTRTRCWFQRVHLTWLRHEVQQILQRGTACDCAKTARICQDLLKIEASLWMFASEAGIEPTNNAAERALRHAVCWRKTSHGTDSERGSRFVERILTVVATCRAQQRSVLTFLTQAINQAEHQTLLPAGA